MSDLFSWVDGEALIINYCILMNNLLIFFIVYISDSFPLTVARLVIFLFVSINEKMYIKISYSFGYFSDPVSCLMTCGKPVTMRFAFQWNLFCFLALWECLNIKKANPKTTQWTVPQQTVTSYYEFECFVFCLFWAIGFFFSWVMLPSFCLKNPISTYMLQTGNGQSQLLWQD